VTFEAVKQEVTCHEGPIDQRQFAGLLKVRSVFDPEESVSAQKGGVWRRRTAVLLPTSAKQLLGV
jgi:hypothetical protein